MSKIIELQPREINSIGGGVLSEDEINEMKEHNRAVNKFMMAYIATSVIMLISGRSIGTDPDRRTWIVGSLALGVVGIVADIALFAGSQWLDEWLQKRYC